MGIQSGERERGIFGGDIQERERRIERGIEREREVVREREGI